MNIFGWALQYCYIKVMLKVTKAWETIKNYNKKYLKLKIYLKAKLKKISFNSSLKSVQCMWLVYACSACSQDNYHNS